MPDLAGDAAPDCGSVRIGKIHREPAPRSKPVEGGGAGGIADRFPGLQVIGDFDLVAFAWLGVPGDGQFSGCEDCPRRPVP